MKNPIAYLNKAFESRIRMGIMSALILNSGLSYRDLKELIQATDGNLASHIKALEENGFIQVKKGFIGKKTNTTYSLTTLGETSFKIHIEALEKIIRTMK